MGSSRLPGKTLKEINNKPLIWYVIERLKLIQKAQVVILTTNSSKDDELTKWCNEHNIKVFRGSESNVLERYYLAAKEFNADNIVRATGDNPLVEPYFANELLVNHINYDVDYSSNKSEIGSNLPDGLGIEIFTFEALKKSYELSTQEHHFEHVNEYILENKSQFKLYKDANCGSFVDKSCIRLTVDTLDDFQRAEKIITNSKFSLDINYTNLLEVVDENLN